MAAILAFEKSRNKSTAFIGTAQILMFTGVRQERILDESNEVKTKRRLVTRQSQIEIEDIA